MLRKKPNKIYDPFLKAGLGYQNLELLKKAIATQPKVYDGDMLHSQKLIINSTDSKETLEDAEEITRAQHQKEVDELIQCVTQKTYAYGDVRAKNQNLLMTISELKSKLSTIKKGKNVNTKFDSFETLGNRVCVTPFNKQIAHKAMNASNTKVNSDRSKPFTSQSTPKQEQGDPACDVDCFGYNLFLVGQFCDEDLEVAFRSNMYYVQNLEGDDLLTGSRDSNLYTISIFEMAASSLVCLMSRATSIKSWLWHRCLSHLNFGTINQLTSNKLVDGLPKLKYTKDHLCSACEQGKSKNASLPPNLVPSTESKLELLHMDLCGPMWVASINGNKYILVIVDDYSRYTWVYFLRTKDEALDMIIDFVNQVQRNLKA
ncbi:retrovirus-related pol polyprotein from transposon TNT 1-94 [Tanacetum coccineum]